jgi:hypothetical protein
MKEDLEGLDEYSQQFSSPLFIYLFIYLFIFVILGPELRGLHLEPLHQLNSL